MIENIKLGKGLSFGSGKLRELCKLLPDEGEVEQMFYVTLTSLFTVSLRHTENLIWSFFWLHAGEAARRF